jgi:EAL domain-containing protein (putative c-di-GMP-specific phosphodiesterase class I)/GGDEF domain-containing protein
MTLSKQLILLISFIFLVIFSINFVTSINNIRDYLEVESEVHAQDTATSLGLSLSPHILDEDDTILSTMINAIFDRGYYLEILLENRKGKELYRKTNPKSFEEVPTWFTDMLPMKTAKTMSEIDAGWVKGGTVYVTIHPGIGYLKLWEQAKKSLTYSLVTLAIFIAILISILRLVLRPLGRIEKMALEIADGHFGKIEQLPWTTEIRNVAISMNLMSGKIEKIISNLNSKLEESSKKLRVDELTGLEMRSTFETEMKQRFMSSGTGYVFLVRIAELGHFASQQNSQKVDDFIQQFAHVIQHTMQSNGYNEKLFYRFVGAEFALIAEAADKNKAETLARDVLKNLSEMGKNFDKANVANLGGIIFDPHGTTAGMIAAAAEEYEKACLIGDNSFSISDSHGSGHDMNEWKDIVRAAIENDTVDITFAAQAYRLDGSNELVLEEAMSQVRDTNGEKVAIGTFISVAEKIDSIADFDLLVINKVIDYIKNGNISHEVAINLSFTTLASNEFRGELYHLLETNPELASQLVFSVTAYGAAKDINAFTSFIDFAHRNGAKIILKRYESRFISMDQVKQFKLDYIRLARVYTENIGTDSDKSSLVGAMKELGDLLDIRVVAEAVDTDRDFDAVRKIGLFAASR